MSLDAFATGLERARGPSRRRVLGGILAVGLFVVVVVLVTGSAEPTGPSALSRQGTGWWMAREYLAARGVDVALRDLPLQPPAAAASPSATQSDGDRPFEPLDPESTLVLAFPLRANTAPDADSGSNFATALGRHVRRGGRAVLAYSGDDRRQSPAQLDAFDAVGARGLSPRLRDRAPLGYRGWREHRDATWSLPPSAPVLDGAVLDGAVPNDPAARDTGESTRGSTWDLEPVGPLRLGALDRVPTPPPDARVLYAHDDQAVVATWRFGRGSVLMLPAEALANGWIDENARFAEALASRLRAEQATVVFSEFHHGLVRAGWIERSGARFAWDLFLLHLVLLYAAGVWSLARRFGPVWREPPRRLGSTGAFLRSLGRLHDRAGHHRAAAQALYEALFKEVGKTARSDARAPARTAPDTAIESGPPAPDEVDDADSLVRYARLAARFQAGTPLSPTPP